MRTVKNIPGKARKKITAQIESLQDTMNQLREDIALYGELSVIRTEASVLRMDISVLRTLKLAESVQGGVDKLSE